MINDEPNGVYLSLPWPDPILNPNQHVHWAKKNKARMTAKKAGYYLALEKGVKLNPIKKYQVNMVFCPPDERTRDLDNLSASMKAALDGMCRAMGIDDRIIRPVPDWGPVVDGGKVEIVIKLYAEST